MIPLGRRDGTRCMPLVCIAALAFLCLHSLAAADTLELKSGGLLHGRYTGGTADTVRFETAEGLKVLSRKDVLALTFDEAPANAVSLAPQPSPPAPAAPNAAAAPKEVSLPGGSLLIVQMKSQVTSGDKAGKGFEAILTHDLEANGVVVAKAGTPVIGRVDESKKAGRLAGKSTLQISLTQLNINGKLIAVSTSNYAETGDSSFKKTARNAGAGAAVGAAFDGGEGAAKGAAIGTAVSVIKKGESVTIPPGAVLEFRLTQPVKVTVGS